MQEKSEQLRFNLSMGSDPFEVNMVLCGQNNG